MKPFTKQSVGEVAPEITKRKIKPAKRREEEK